MKLAKTWICLPITFLLGAFTFQLALDANYKECEQPSWGLQNFIQGEKGMATTQEHDLSTQEQERNSYVRLSPSILNRDAIRAAQSCRYIKGRYSGAPLINGDTFRLFCDFIWEYDKYEDSGCILTGDEPFWPGCSIFVKATHLPAFFEEIHPLIKVPYVLVSGNADWKVPTDITRKPEKQLRDPPLEDDNLFAWFGMNMNTSQYPSKLFQIPIGTTNLKWKDASILSDKINLYDPNADRECLIFLSWLGTTHFRKHDPSVKYVKNLSISDPSIVFWKDPKDVKEWVDQVLKCKYVMSPPGHGVDTHRHWEVLMYGAVPVTLSGILDDLYKEVPILILDNFYEITSDMLKSRYEEFESRIYEERYKYYATYWLQKIRIKMSEAERSFYAKSDVT